MLDASYTGMQPKQIATITLLCTILAALSGACSDHVNPIPLDIEQACQGMDDFHYTYDDSGVEFLTCTYWCEGTTDPEYQSVWLQLDGTGWESFDEYSYACE
jgi:hypothetical protein